MLKKKKNSLILRTSTRLALEITCSHNTAKNLSEFIHFLRLQRLHISFCGVKQQQQQQQTKLTKNICIIPFLKAKNCIPVFIFLHIFISVYLRETYHLCSRDVVRFYLVRMDCELNNLFKASGCLGLVKWFTLFLL